MRRYGRITAGFLILVLIMVVLGACAHSLDPEEQPAAETKGASRFDESLSAEELYRAALGEDVPMIYSVSTRVTQVKEAFEAAYPGLCVEVRDMRSPDLIAAVESSVSDPTGRCDLVICNDNSGEFKSRLVDTGIVVPYVPVDIMDKMKPGCVGDMVSFLKEAELLFYNSAKYTSCPITNIWELTRDEYKGLIYLPSPLRSFSTYAFCASTFDKCEEFEASYRACFGEDMVIPEGSDAAEVFWNALAQNIVFTNSSDEVVEALGNGTADFGIMVSSKLRLKDVGYMIEPVYELDPFSGCATSFSVMVAEGSSSPNCTMLFVRFLLGETDGTGEGYKPFCTLGTWSARVDVPDGSPVALEDISLITPDQDYLIANSDRMEEFWSRILKESNSVNEE